MQWAWTFLPDIITCNRTLQTLETSLLSKQDIDLQDTSR
jgi:hypothetical protein